MIQWFLSLELWAQIGVILGALDIILGALPDSVIKWPGAILAVAHRLHQYGKDARGK